MKKGVGVSEGGGEVWTVEGGGGGVQLGSEEGRRLSAAKTTHTII